MYRTVETTFTSVCYENENGIRAWYHKAADGIRELMCLDSDMKGYKKVQHLPVYDYVNAAQCFAKYAHNAGFPYIMN